MLYFLDTIYLVGVVRSGRNWLGPAAKLLSGSNLYLCGLYCITAGKKSYSDLISITVFLFQLGFRIELTLWFMWVIVFEGNNIYYLFWLGDHCYF